MNKVTALAHQVMDDHARSNGMIPRSRRQLAQKLILIEKALRYQRAAYRLCIASAHWEDMCVWFLASKCIEKMHHCNDKSVALQAEAAQI